jgi:hypothetical protein
MVLDSAECTHLFVRPHRPPQRSHSSPQPRVNPPGARSEFDILPSRDSTSRRWVISLPLKPVAHDFPSEIPDTDGLLQLGTSKLMPRIFCDAIQGQILCNLRQLRRVLLRQLSLGLILLGNMPEKGLGPPSSSLHRIQCLAGSSTLRHRVLNIQAWFTVS